MKNCMSKVPGTNLNAALEKPDSFLFSLCEKQLWLKPPVFMKGLCSTSSITHHRFSPFLSGFDYKGPDDF